LQFVEWEYSGVEDLMAIRVKVDSDRLYEFLIVKQLMSHSREVFNQKVAAAFLV
jgi:hypothetical protein